SHPTRAAGRGQPASLDWCCRPRKAHPATSRPDRRAECPMRWPLRGLRRLWQGRGGAPGVPGDPAEAGGAVFVYRGGAGGPPTAGAGASAEGAAAAGVAFGAAHGVAPVPPALAGAGPTAGTACAAWKLTAARPATDISQNRRIRPALFRL